MADIPRTWLSWEDEETLRLLGVADPLRDPVSDDVLDRIQRSAENASEEYERDQFYSLLSTLEEECV